MGDCREMKDELNARGQRILSELRTLFPGIQCIEEVSLRRVYQLHDTRRVSQARRPSRSSLAAWNVADVFENIETRKERLKIADYSITQASLEHVFNQFATQDSAGDTAPG